MCKRVWGGGEGGLEVKFSILPTEKQTMCAGGAESSGTEIEGWPIRTFTADWFGAKTAPPDPCSAQQG